MTAVAAARDDLRTYTQKRWPLDNLKGQLNRLLRERADPKKDHPLRDWSTRRVRSVFNGEEHVSLRATERAELDALIEGARHEYRDLAQLAASLQALLYGPEADFYRPQVDAIREALVPQGRGIAQGSGGTGAGDHGAAKTGEAA